MFVENRVGVLAGLLGIFDNTDVKTLALTVIQGFDCAIVRFVFNDTDLAPRILRQYDYRFSVCELVAVEMPDNSSGEGLARIGCTAVFLTGILAVVCGCSQPHPAVYQPPHDPAPGRRAVARALGAFPAGFDRQFFASLRIGRHEWTMVGRLNVHSARRFRLTCASELGTLIFDARAGASRIQILKIAAGAPAQLPISLCRQLRLALTAPALAAANISALVRLHHEARIRCRDAAGNVYALTFAGPAGHLHVCTVNLAGGARLQIQYLHYETGGLPGELALWNPGRDSLFFLDFIRACVKR